MRSCQDTQRGGKPTQENHSRDLVSSPNQTSFAESKVPFPYN